MTAKPDRLRNLVKLLVGDVLEALAFAFELFVNLNRLFGHLLVRIFRPAQQREIGTRGDALVAIIIEANTEHQRFGFLRGTLRHATP